MEECSSDDEKFALAETYDAREVTREEFEVVIRVPSATFLDALVDANITRREFVDFMEKELKEDEIEKYLCYVHSANDVRLFQLLDGMAMAAERGQPKVFKQIQEYKKIAFMTIDELIAKIKGDLPLNKFKYKAELKYRLEKLAEEEITADLLPKILGALDHHRGDTVVGSLAAVVVPVVGASLFPIFELDEIETVLMSNGVRNTSLLGCITAHGLQIARYEYVNKAVKNIVTKHPEQQVVMGGVDPSLELMSAIEKGADASRVFLLLHPNGPQGNASRGRQLLCARTREGLSCVGFVRQKQMVAKQEGDRLYQAIYPMFDSYQGILNEFFKFIRNQLLDSTLYVIGGVSDVRQLLEILNEFSPAEIKEILSAVSSSPSDGSVRSVIFRLRIHNVIFSDLKNVSLAADEMSIDAEMNLQLGDYSPQSVEDALNAGLNLRNPRVAQLVMQKADISEVFIQYLMKTFRLKQEDALSPPPSPKVTHVYAEVLDPITAFVDCIRKDDVGSARAMILDKVITAENVVTLFADSTVFHLVIMYSRPEIAMLLYKEFGKVAVLDAAGRMPEAFIRRDENDEKRTHQKIIDIYEGKYELDPITEFVDCITNNKIEDAEALIKSGKVNFENVSTLFAGTTVFHLVIFYNRPEIAILLHQYFGLGWVKDQQGQLPEMCINIEAQDERRTHETIVRMYANKLIFGAIICKRLEMLFHLLMDLHCDANATSNSGVESSTALDFLLERASAFSPEELEAFARVLVLNGAHVKLSNVETAPPELKPFMQSSYNKLHNIKNFEVALPRLDNIFLALIFNNIPEVEYWVEKHSVDDIVEGSPLIFLVIKYMQMTRSADAFKYFLEKGVKIDVTDKEGKTVEERLKACAGPKLIELFNEYKAKVSWKAPQDVSITVASQHGSPVVSPVVSPRVLENREPHVEDDEEQTAEEVGDGVASVATVSPRTMERINQQVEALERRTDEVEANITILESIWRKVNEADARTAALEEQIGISPRGK